MTVCTALPSLRGLTISVLVLVLGLYLGVYRIQKKIQKRTMKILYCVFSIFLLLAATLFILVGPGNASCAGIGKPRLVYDFQTEIETVREAEDAFASYLRVYSPESLPPFLDCNQCKRNCTDKGYEGCSCRCSSYIEEFDTMYRIYGNYGPGTFTLYKNGKLYRQPIVGMI